LPAGKALIKRDKRDKTGDCGLPARLSGEIVAELPEKDTGYRSRRLLIEFQPTDHWQKSHFMHNLKGY
jgi:hypothetical protein